MHILYVRTPTFLCVADLLSPLAGWHTILGRVCPYSGGTERRPYRQTPHHESISSNAAEKLVDSLLGSFGEMDLRCHSFRILDNASLLL